MATLAGLMNDFNLVSAQVTQMVSVFEQQPSLSMVEEVVIKHQVAKDLLNAMSKLITKQDAQQMITASKAYMATIQKFEQLRSQMPTPNQIEHNAPPSENTTPRSLTSSIEIPTSNKVEVKSGTPPSPSPTVGSLPSSLPKHTTKPNEIHLKKKEKMQGHLLKRGDKGIKLWKRRFFRREKDRLYYFETDTSDKSFGFIDMDSMNNQNMEAMQAAEEDKKRQDALDDMEKKMDAEKERIFEQIQQRRIEAEKRRKEMAKTTGLSVNLTSSMFKTGDEEVKLAPKPEPPVEEKIQPPSTPVKVELRESNRAVNTPKTPESVEAKRDSSLLQYKASLQIIPHTREEQEQRLNQLIQDDLKRDEEINSLLTKRRLLKVEIEEKQTRMVIVEENNPELKELRQKLVGKRDDLEMVKSIVVSYQEALAAQKEALVSTVELEAKMSQSIPQLNESIAKIKAELKTQDTSIKERNLRIAQLQQEKTLKSLHQTYLKAPEAFEEMLEMRLNIAKEALNAHQVQYQLLCKDDSTRPETIQQEMDLLDEQFAQIQGKLTKLRAGYQNLRGKKSLLDKCFILEELVKIKQQYFVSLFHSTNLNMSIQYKTDMLPEKAEAMYRAVERKEIPSPQWPKWIGKELELRYEALQRDRQGLGGLN